MKQLIAALVLCTLGQAVLASAAAAKVVRYAIVIGHNQGDTDEPPLRYAEDDAARVHQTLLELGRHAPQNTVLLRHLDADTVRRTLISINERVRQSAASGDQVALLVYYSGHADADSLHLGGSALDLGELRELVAGSAAEVRLLVLDACRSGALTRVKGGTPAAAFAIEVDERLAGQGAIFLTSSSAGEDSQESDRLRGSFFTHYFVSGLLGAADDNGDSIVSLAEAYRYAYEHTLRASSRTLSGSQHPTFQYQVKGHGEIPLSYLTDGREHRAQLEFPPGRSYLLMRESAQGPVVAEVGSGDSARRVTLLAGRYHVLGRARDHLLEGAIDAHAGERRTVQDGELERIEYAQLVRKGGEGVPSAAHGPQMGYRLRTPFWSDASSCHGAFVGYALSLRSFDIAPRAGFCFGDFENERIEAQTYELDLSVRLTHTWDLDPIAVQLGVLLGGALLTQSFETLGRAPQRLSAAFEVGAGAGLELPLSRGAYLVLDAYVVTYGFREGFHGDESFTLRPVAQVSLGAGSRI